MGAAVGGLLGAALIATAEPDHRTPYENNENNSPEGIGLLLLGGGAPVGAVLNTRIPRDHEGAYIMAVLGEIVVGGAGAALGMRLGNSSDQGRLIGGLALGGAGVIFGAAGGAMLAASDGSGGALNYENGSWRAQPPAVQVGVHQHPQPGLHGTVSLVSVEL